MRCSATLFILAHDAMMRRKRDEQGRPTPHVVEWECRRCGRTVGETVAMPKWGLLARLRRQRSRNRIAA